MPRSSARALEVLRKRLASDAALTAEAEVRANVLSRIRGLQRRGLDEDQEDVAVMLTLLRRDVLVQSGSTTPEAMNLRVRQSEQLHKCGNALRRQGRSTPSGALWGPAVRRKVPTARMYEQEPGGEPENGDTDAA